MKKQTLLIVTSLTLILIFILGANAYKKHQSDKTLLKVSENSSLLVREHSITLGNKDAKVHIVEFFDPACETCAQFHPLVKKIMKENEGKIKLTLRYATFHEGSEHIVKILEAARKQDKFWETLELAFLSQSYWAVHHKADPNILWKFLPKVDLDMDKMFQDVSDPNIDKMIAQDMADAEVLGAKKTPSFFVNGKLLQKFGYEELKALIHSEMNK